MASTDQRFVKVARFLLDGRGLDVAADVRPDGIDDVLEDGDVDAVLLDSDGGLGNALRLSNTIRANRPTLPVVIVGADTAERAPRASPSTTNGIRWTRQSTHSPPVSPRVGEVIAQSEPIAA